MTQAFVVIHEGDRGMNLGALAVFATREEAEAYVRRCPEYHGEVGGVTIDGPVPVGLAAMAALP